MSAVEFGYLRRYLNRTAALARGLPVDVIAEIVDVLLSARAADRFIYVVGNGGSAATASHFVNDLGKGGMTGFTARFKVMAFTDNVPLMTAWANDTDYEYVFAEQLRNFCRPGDVLMGISGSGNSSNVLRAIELARERGATTIGLTGVTGGKMKGLVDICFSVPSDDMQHIEDMHMVAAHLIYAAIRDRQAEPLQIGPGRPPRGAAPNDAMRDEGEVVLRGRAAEGKLGE